MRWRLLFRNLNAPEIAALQDFYEWAGGSLKEFTFFDPLANLLSSSEDLLSDAWSKEPGIQCVPTGSEPAHGAAWRVTNTGGTEALISQVLSADAGYVFCFSSEIKCAPGSVVTLVAGGVINSVSPTTEWARYHVSGGSMTQTCALGIRLAPGMSVEMREPQVEPQLSPSIYKVSSITPGIYGGARFAGSGLRTIATAPGLFGAEVEIWSPLER